MKKHLLLLAMWLIGSTALLAQNTADIVVPITVTMVTNPPAITLSFPATANATATFIGRKQINETAWGFLQLPAAATSFTDNNVIAGLGFEYIVIKTSAAAPTQRIGLVYAGIEVLPTVYRGKMIFVVDNALSTPLSVELDRYVQDLRGDGWQVLRHDIDVAASTVASVKALIRSDYESDPGSVSGAFLFGNIPVPYSGNIAPDGHTPDHLGAWPTDYYYGDMDEAGWTDNVVNNIGAARAANRNVPGDGKFDQSLTPSLAEIVVSRVDFSNLTTGWDVSQTELYRRYLNKNHAFRTGAYKPSNQTIVDDNFGFASGEAFAQNGFRNGYALTGTNSVVQGDFINNTKNQSFLIGNGCGAGGYASANGVANSANFQTDSVNVVFSMLFGSYFGDWDYESNPLLPSALASKGGILTTAWAGRPNWHFHHMGLGEPILTSTFWVWLNSFLGQARVYPPSSNDELIHVGLLGDPTLRAHAVRPPQNVAATASCETINLAWDASPDAQLGYLVYWAPDPDSVFQLIVNAPVFGTAFVDSFPVDGANYYQVRTFKLETVPTGSYYNQSIGIGASAVFGSDPFTADAAVTHISCNGAANGAVTLVVSGGNNLTYLWSNGADTPDLSDLEAGIYTVTISDAQGCTTTAEATIDEPTALGIGADVTPVSCFGLTDGGIVLNVSGGVLPYFIEWSTGDNDVLNLTDLSAGIYAATVIDGNGCIGIATDEVTEPTELELTLAATDADCNGAATGSIESTVNGGTPGYVFVWSNGSDAEVLTDLAAGTYTVTVADENGCSRIESAGIGEPTAITAGTTTTEAGCAGATNGSVELTVGGGTPGYTFEWSNNSTGQNLANVASGTYTVTITDDTGCTRTASATVGQITTLAVQAESDPVLCFGETTGAASVQANGGTPGYTYLWSNNQTSDAVANLAAGLYTVTVTDAVGCSQSATVSIGQPAEISAGAVWQANPCVTDIGTVTLTVSGGTPGYNFDWSTSAATQNLENIAPGIYTVTITDANGCTTELSNSTVQPVPVLVAETAFEQSTCPGVEPVLGNVLAFVLGGTPTYTYAWSNGDTSPGLQNVPIGPYTVTVTDGAGCTTVHENVVFRVYQPWNVNATPTTVSCFGGSNGNIGLLVAGGTGPSYSYAWSNGSTAKDLTNVVAGTYTLTITDAIGCTTVVSATIDQPDMLVASIGATAAVSCPGLSDGQAGVLAAGGTTGYSYLWSNGQQTPTAANLPAGTIGCTVTDANGCTATTSTTITEPVPPLVSIVGADTACIGGTLLYSLPGTVGNYQWTVSANGTITQGQGTGQIEVIWQTPGAGTVGGAYTWSANNCPDDVSLAVEVKVCVGTREPTLAGVRVQPNPFGSRLDVLFDRPVQSGTRLRLLNAQGRLISEQTTVTETTNIETDHLPAGAYLLQIVENGQVGVWKLVKMD
ncbi:MAG: T9SS type A sorting domain-containing protein [Lewinellaceae bacterium]|nr:T9SS type A sorting domain-containing protein [Lewinellaceae bacterium]